MRRRPLLLAVFLFALFPLLRWLLAPSAPSVLGCVGDSAVFAKGRDAAFYGPDGAISRHIQLPRKPRRILDLEGALAFVPRGSNDLWVSQVAGGWKILAPPVKARGEGVWAVSNGDLYYLPPRSSFVSIHPKGETAWRDFQAEGEELENPGDLSARGDHLALLNLDPAEAAVADPVGKTENLVDLTRETLWPLQRPVFERLSDYLHPRRPETPRRLALGPDGRLAVLFTTAEGDGARLVVFACRNNQPLVIKEPILPLRSPRRWKGVQLSGFEWMPDGSLVLTSNVGGLWRLGPDLMLKNEWERPPEPSAPWVARTMEFLPWLALLFSLSSLVWAAWPTKEFDDSRPIPRRAWVRGAVCLIVPGLGLALQRHWGWAVFWFAFFLSWGALCVFLTSRMRQGDTVTPATYIETCLATAGAGVFSGLQAFWAEWTRPEEDSVP